MCSLRFVVLCTSNRAQSRSWKGIRIQRCIRQYHIRNVSINSLNMRILDLSKRQVVENLLDFYRLPNAYTQHLFEERPLAIISSHRIISFPATQSLKKENTSLQIQVDASITSLYKEQSIPVECMKKPPSCFRARDNEIFQCFKIKFV